MSETSSFPVSRALLLSQRSGLNLTEVKCLSQGWSVTAVRAVGADDKDRSQSKTIASQERNLGHGDVQTPAQPDKC